MYRSTVAFRFPFYFLSLSSTSENHNDVPKLGPLNSALFTGVLLFALLCFKRVSVCFKCRIPLN